MAEMAQVATAGCSKFEVVVGKRHQLLATNGKYCVAMANAHLLSRALKNPMWRTQHAWCGPTGTDLNHVSKRAVGCPHEETWTVSRLHSTNNIGA